MNLEGIGLALTVSVSLGALVWLLLQVPGTARVSANLRRGIREEDARTALKISVPQARGRLRQALATNLVSKRNVRWTERLIGKAGYPAKWPLERIVAAKLLLGLGSLAFAVFYVWYDQSLLSIGVSVVLVLGCYFAPEIILYEMGVQRSEAIGLELPDTIDQMSIAVEAGLGFEAAMNRVARNGKGVLAEELVRALQDIQAGGSRRDVYTALAERVQVPDLTRFVRAVVRAETYGLAMAGVLRTQASELRLKRRQRAEEQAQQIPVKVVFPLITCIMPTLLIVVLGPAAIQILQVLSGR